MNKIEKQILENQKVLIEVKLGYSGDNELQTQLDLTNDILNLDTDKLKEDKSCDKDEEDRRCSNCGHLESWHFDTSYRISRCNIHEPECYCKKFVFEEKSE